MSKTLKVQCQDCGKRYELRGQAKSPVIVCPRCAAKIKVPGFEGESRSALREELARLAAEEPDSTPRQAPKMRVVDQSEEQILSSRGRVAAFIISILLILALFGGGGAWLVFRLGANASAAGPDASSKLLGGQDADPDTSLAVSSDTPVDTAVQPQPADKLPSDVQLAFAEALKPHDPCGEDEALERWRKVAETLAPYEAVAAKQVETAKERIDQLEAVILERERGVKLLEARLEQARRIGEDGDRQRATNMLSAIVRDVGKLDCRGPVADKVRQDAIDLQKAYAEADTSSTTTEDSGERPPAIVDDADFILDKPAPGTETRWRDEKAWANAVDLKLLGAGENLYRSIEHQRGGKDKWVVSMRRPFDLSPYQHFVLDMKVEETVRVALGVWVGNDLYESREKAVRKGTGWQPVTYDVKGRDFKCAATNWNYGATITDPSKVTGFSLFFYSQARKPILFANVRLHKAK